MAEYPFDNRPDCGHQLLLMDNHGNDLAEQTFNNVEEIREANHNHNQLENNFCLKANSNCLFDDKDQSTTTAIEIRCDIANPSKALFADQIVEIESSKELNVQPSVSPKSFTKQIQDYKSKH